MGWEGSTERKNVLWKPEGTGMESDLVALVVRNKLEEFQIQPLGSNTVVPTKLVHGCADLVRVMHRRLWLWIEPSSSSN